MDLLSAITKLNDSDVVAVVAQQACRHHRACLLYNSQLTATCNFGANTAKCLRCSDRETIFSEDILRCFDSDPYGEKFILDNPCEEQTDYYVHIPREREREKGK